MVLIMIGPQGNTGAIWTKKEKHVYLFSEDFKTKMRLVFFFFFL